MELEPGLAQMSVPPTEAFLSRRAFFYLCWTKLEKRLLRGDGAVVEAFMEKAGLLVGRDEFTDRHGVGKEP